MNLSIFGLGYVGCVGMGCLARLGHVVTGVDAQKTKADYLAAGRPTIRETGIAELLAEQHAAGRIHATTDPAAAVAATDVSFVCVGTPASSTGQLDLSAIRTVAAQIGEALRSKPVGAQHPIIVRSTVPPGTCEKLSTIVAESSGRRAGHDFAVVANPEFLREGSSVHDFDNPPYTLAGSDCEWATETLRDIYHGIDAPFYATAPRVAELMKSVCNGFHALKISFANEIGRICHGLGVDSHEVMELFCRDTKLNISPAYLKPGFAYGGSCLPKDLGALLAIAHEHYIRAPVLEAVPRTNELQKELVLERILASGAAQVGFLGLAFKSGTDDLRESPIVDVIERLLGKGISVRVYDPHVHMASLTGANRQFILARIPFIAKFLTEHASEIFAASDLIVVVNRLPETDAAMRTLNAGVRVLQLVKAPTPETHPERCEGVSW